MQVVSVKAILKTESNGVRTCVGWAEENTSVPEGLQVCVMRLRRQRRDALAARGARRGACTCGARKAFGRRARSARALALAHFLPPTLAYLEKGLLELSAKVRLAYERDD